VPLKENTACVTHIEKENKWRLKVLSLFPSISFVSVFFIIATNDEFVKSHIPYVVHASTSSARTEYQ